jgi:hypothetical protein
MKTFAKKSQNKAKAKNISSALHAASVDRQTKDTMRRLLGACAIMAKLEVGASDDFSEHEADRMADAVVNGKGVATQVRNYRAPGAAKTHSAETGNFLSKANGGGTRSLNALESNYFESRFNSNFSHVRIHDSPEAATAASSINARAFTYGSDIYLNSGEYRFSTQKGKRLIAHELAHVVQQRNRPVIQRKTLEEELEQELQAWAVKEGKLWAAKEEEPNTKHRDYIYDLKDYACGLISKDCITPKPMPTSRKGKKKWKRDFQKAQVLVEKILAAGSKVADKEAQAGIVLNILAQAGFGDAALKFGQKMKKPDYFYKTILSYPQNVSSATLTEVTKYFIKKSGKKSFIVSKLTDATDLFEKKFTNDQLTGILKPLIDEYEKDPIIIEIVSEVLIFRKKYRKIFSKWMWKADKGALLFKILESKYFIEPGYGATALGNANNALTLKDDMPWVYSNKQKYYVNFLVELGKQTKVKIKKPKNMKFKTLRKWIETHTANFGKALAKKYPNKPQQWIKVYEQLADIFFYHTSQNVTADRSGKVKKLKQGMPDEMRLKADCDVLATYAMRFFSSIKDNSNSNFNAFEPIGYLFVIPDKSVGHTVALMRRNGTYYIISNKEVIKTKIREKTKDGKKDKALKKMRDIALDIYETPPGQYKVYYDDADADGAMSKDLYKQKEDTRKKNLE